MKLGISSSYFCRDFAFDRGEVFKRIADCGFDYVQLPITDAYMDFSDADWGSIKEDADRAGLGLFFGMALSAKNDISSEAPEIRKNGMEFLKKVLRGVQLTGAPGVGGINYTAWCSFDGEIHKQIRRENSIQSLKEIAKYCEDLDIVFGMEIVNRYENFLLNTAQEARDFCEEIGSESVKIVLDIFHMCIEEDDPPQAIRTAGNLLYNLHLCENNRRMPMGRCTAVDWRNIIQALWEIHYDEMLTFEPFADPYGDRAKGTKIWRELADDISPEGLSADAKKGLSYIKGLLACNGEGDCKCKEY